MNDDFVNETCFDKNGRKLGGQHLTKLLVDNVELKEYLMNRFCDSESISETITRILYRIEKRPTCKVCGKILNFKPAYKGGFRTYCSLKCQNSDPDKIALTKQIKFEKYGDENYNNMDKQKKTVLEKYGTEYYQQTSEFKEKSKKTCREKYGTDYALQNKEVMKKSKMTLLEKYGVDNAMKNESIKEKAKLTCFEHYGVDNSKKSDIIKQKERETCLAKYGVTSYRKTKECEEKIRKTVMGKYGVDHVTKSDKWKEKWYGNEEWSRNRSNKIFHSMKKNNSFPMNSSELQLKKYIEKEFPDMIYQYKDERYPFVCDFYIKNKDLFIEYNGHWTHGGHFFNEENIEDIEKLKKWKEKKTKFYDAAVKTWTVRDTKKLEIAKQNKLNYLVLWPNDVKDLNKVKTMIDEF